MRNLSAYPITKEEIINYLRKLSDEKLSEERVGDMGPLLLTTAASLIENSDQEIPGYGIDK